MAQFGLKENLHILQLRYERSKCGKKKFDQDAFDDVVLVKSCKLSQYFEPNVRFLRQTIFKKR